MGDIVGDKHGLHVGCILEVEGIRMPAGGEGRMFNAGEMKGMGVV